jgi:hypothetical protein
MSNKFNKNIKMEHFFNKTSKKDSKQQSRIGVIVRILLGISKRRSSSFKVKSSNFTVNFKG